MINPFARPAVRYALGLAVLGQTVGVAAQTAPAAAPPAAPATSSVTIYGVVDVGVDLTNHGKGNLTRVISGGYMGNRLGFRGTEDLGGGVSAVFRLESGFSTDTGTLGQGGRMFGREASVGLKSNTLGTVLLGRLPTPYYLVARTVDAFGWMGSGGTLSLSRGPGSSTLQPLSVSARMDNAVRYDSPSWGGFTLGALVAAGEGSASLGRGTSVAGAYANGPLALSLGWAEQKGANNVAATGKITAMVAGGNFNFGPAQVFAGYNREKNDCTTCTGALARGAGVTKADFSVSNLGVRVPVGQALVLMGQVLRIGDKSVYAVNPGDRDANWFAVGAEYSLSKRTLLWGSAGTVKNRNGSQYALGTGTVPLDANAVAAGDPRARNFAVGVRHLF